jgi:hypothetical protein
MAYKNKEDKNAYYRNRRRKDQEYNAQFLTRTKSWESKNPGKKYTTYEDRKLRVLTHYGKDGKLCCCWEDCFVNDPDMLTLDHINNDGAADRKSTGPGTYRQIESRKYPTGFQTLCCNHQWKKEVLRRRSLRKA